MDSRYRWSAERANRWYKSIPWPVGCNFIPSTAINQLEMWQADTYDPTTIDRELGWAAAIGFNTVRVYLHDLLWLTDADGLRDRMDRHLAIAARHGIRTIFVLFDDCWNKEPRLGPQPAPQGPQCSQPASAAGARIFASGSTRAAASLLPPNISA
jgi:hypothetical protein